MPKKPLIKKSKPKAKSTSTRAIEIKLICIPKFKIKDTKEVRDSIRKEQKNFYLFVEAMNKKSKKFEYEIASESACIVTKHKNGDRDVEVLD